MFFSFDGPDGAGKSTQVALFREWLAQQGHDVVACRDPGSTALGERIRETLLAADADWPIHRRSEMFLYMAARSQLVEEIIRPALAARKSVIADRYLLANIVYQGYAGGLAIDMVRQVGEFCTDGIVPDCVFVMDIAPELAALRLIRNLDRMEQHGLDFQRRIRDGFLAEAHLSKGRAHIINATGPIDSIQQEIQSIAQRYLESKTAKG
jgi:dTMP kinase